MKLLIFEGQDNLGKTTLIHEIAKMYKSSIIRKFQSPPPHLSTIEKVDWQKQNFLEEFRFYVTLQKLNLTSNDDNILIWDRSHLGEQVYGTLYRGQNPSDWLYDMELPFNFQNDKNVYLVLIEGSIDFIMNGLKEDGLTFQMNEEQVENFYKNESFKFGDENLFPFSEIAHEKNRTKDLIKLSRRLEKILFRYSYDNSNIKNKTILTVNYFENFEPIQYLAQSIYTFLNK